MRPHTLTHTHTHTRANIIHTSLIRCVSPKLESVALCCSLNALWLKKRRGRETELEGKVINSPY